MGAVLYGFYEDGFWKINAKLCFNDKIDPIIIKFLVDSGAGLTVLSPFTSEKMGIYFNDLSESSGINIGGSGECMARELEIEGIAFKEAKYSEGLMVRCHKVYVADPACWQRDYNVIGQDILRNFNIVFINNKNKIIKLILNEDEFVSVPFE
jgi:hypothetical protein